MNGRPSCRNKAAAFSKFSGEVWTGLNYGELVKSSGRVGEELVQISWRVKSSRFLSFN